MFNIYQFEKQAMSGGRTTKNSARLAQKWTTHDAGSSKYSTNTQTRRKSESGAKVRERLVAGYKSRVTSFIKEMTV